MIPNIGNNMARNSLCKGLFGKTRQAVLALLYGHADRSFYTTQVLDAVKTGRGTVQRELKTLTDAGFILREVQGRQVYYRANDKCPIFSELKSIVEKTSGLADGDSPDTIAQRFRIPEDRLAEYCRRHYISKLALFGSVLRADFRPDSDIDVLVEFDPGHMPGLFGLAEMEAELSSLLGGRKVDLRTPAELSRRFRDHVVREARVQYAATR